MQTRDPIAEAEKIVKEMNDGVGKYTQPVLQRYPLLFSFLTVFGMAAILHGFEVAIAKIEIFQNHPTYLIFIGTVTLLFTGMLYKALGKN